MPTTDQPLHRDKGAHEQAQMHAAATHGITGTEWVIDAVGCDPWLLRDDRLLRQLTDSIVADLKLNVLGSPLVHVFPGPAGVTLLYLLSESHLAAHTYPEHQTATFNLYCCRDRKPWDWETQLKSRLLASAVQVRRLYRGSVPGNTSPTLEEGNASC